MKKIFPLLMAASMLIGLTACNANTPTETTIPTTATSITGSDSETEPAYIVPEGYYETADIFSTSPEDLGISMAVPEDMLGDWTVTGQNDYIKIEAKPVYIKEYGVGVGDEEATKFIKPMIVVQITNLSEEELIWHWDSAKADDSEGLMTYLNAYNATIQPGESATRILSVTPGSDKATVTKDGTKYVISSAEIGSFAQENVDPFGQLGDTVVIVVDFSDIEVPEF